MAGLPKSGVILVAEDAPSFFATLNQANNAVKGFADQGAQSAGRFSSGFGQVVIGALREVGASLVQFGVQGAKALGGFIKDSISIAADFEQTMNILQATSGATGDELGQISKKAKDLGADLTLPATSAVDAGEAMLELSKAGFTVQQSMDAAKGVLQLSAAAQIDNAQAAEIASNAINAFHLSADDAVFVSDLLAASANASSVEITDVAHSYQMAGAVFENFQGPVVGSKQAIIDMTTAIGLLGNAGIKGSDAGTSLKQALLQLTGPSDKAKGMMRELAASIGVSGDIAYTAQGQMRSFPEILGLVSRATANLTDEKRNQYITDIFGADASRAILILMQQGPDAWDKMSAAVTRQGAAADLAAAQTKGLKGAFEGAKSQLETLQLTLGEKFLPILTDLVNTYLSPAIASVTAFADRVLSANDPVAALTSEVDKLIPGFAGVIATGQQIITFFQQTGIASSVLGGYVDALKTRWDVLQTGITTVANGIWAVIQPVFTQIQAFLAAHGTEISTTVTTAWNQINDIINKVIQIVTLVVGAGLTAIGGFMSAHGDKIYRIIETAWNLIASVITTTLNLIQGIVTFVLQALTGDWQGAHETLLNTSTTFVRNLWDLFGHAMEFLASLLGTSMTEIANVWRGNWDMLVQIVSKVVDILADVGGKIVSNIANGFANAWNGFMQTVNSKLSELKDILPFSEPKNTSSPLYGLSKAGRAIVSNIQSGIDSAPDLGVPNFDPSVLKILPTLGGQLSSVISPPAQSSQMPCNCSGSVTNSKTINMPVYTNQSPAALQQSWAVMNASMP